MLQKFSSLLRGLFFIIISIGWGQLHAQVLDGLPCKQSMIQLHSRPPKKAPKEDVASEKKQLTKLMDEFGKKNWADKASQEEFDRVVEIEKIVQSKQDFVLSLNDPVLESEYFSVLINLEFYINRWRDREKNIALWDHIRRSVGESKLFKGATQKKLRQKAAYREIEAVLSSLRARSQKSFSKKKEIRAALSQYFYLRQISGDTKAVEVLDWLADSKNLEEPGRWNNFRDLVSYVEKRVERTQKNLKGDLTKSGKKKVSLEIKELHRKAYNDLESFDISKIKGIKEFQQKTALVLHHFNRVDEVFRGEDFYFWMKETGQLTDDLLKKLKSRAEKGELVTMGTFLRQKYENFAPYSKTDPFSEKGFFKAWHARSKAMVGKFDSELKACNDVDDSKSCIFRVFNTRLSRLFASDFYKTNFSCVAKNPVVLRSTIMDVAVSWGALFMYYNEAKDTMDRFPLELLVVGSIFTPIYAEANCRSSFKSPLKFGSKLTKAEAFPSKPLKLKRWFKDQRSLAGKGALYTVGLAAATHGFDQIALAMGSELANPLGLKGTLQSIPFLFLYTGVWSNVRRVAINNPLRYKILPKLAEKISKKINKPGTGLAIAAGLDFGAYYYLSKYGAWEFLTLYKTTVMPWLMASFGIGSAVVATKDNYIDIEAPNLDVTPIEGEKVEVIEDEKTMKVIRTLPNGVVTSASVEKLPNGNVKLLEVDMDMPDSVLDELADKILFLDVVPENVLTEDL